MLVYEILEVFGVILTPAVRSQALNSFVPIFVLLLVVFKALKDSAFDAQ